MKIVIDRSYIIMDGILTSLIDCYYNLLKFDIDIKLVISSKNLHEDILQIPKNFNDRSLLKCFTNKLDIEDDVIITSAYTLFNRRLNLHTNKLIVLDCFQSFFYRDIKSDIYLTNPVNKRPDTLLYYHKFYKERIENLQLRNEYHYNRTKKNNSFFNGIYFENIGKKIFEHLYNGKRVFYDSEGLTIKDGLCYYLELFGIDGFENQELKLDREEIEDKLFMKEDDLLLKCIL